MRRTILMLAVTALGSLTATSASAMDRYGQLAPGGARAAIGDPDEKLERLAAASSPTDAGHGKPKKSARGILRDDRYLQGAFASLDNK